MHKSIAILITLFVILLVQSGWAAMTPEEARERALQLRKQTQSNFPKPLVRGSVGKFQAIRMDENSVFILDTTEGHLWLWIIEKKKTKLLYQGKASIADKMGEILGESGL